jgi:hypothetical protein
MNSYEISLHKQQNTAPQIRHLTQVSDFAAIRKARQIAAGEKVEVWRDADCIYADERLPIF